MPGHHNVANPPNMLNTDTGSNTVQVDASAFLLANAEHGGNHNYRTTKKKEKKNYIGGKITTYYSKRK